MEAKGIEALKARFAGIEVQANPKTMDEIVEYIETKWQGQRVKIKESEYIIHYKNALEFMKRLGKPIEGVQEGIRRYMLPNRIGIVLGMKSEYITVEDGMKYYQALTVLKGLTQEDIDTKNDRWLQYMMMLEMQAEWDAREAAAKAAEEAEKAEQAQGGSYGKILFWICIAPRQTKRREIYTDELLDWGKDCHYVQQTPDHKK